jgi:hypothetical protein
MAREARADFMDAPTVRVNNVAAIIRDAWPHRMSLDAAKSIDAYYRRILVIESPGPGEGRHRAEV